FDASDGPVHVWQRPIDLRDMYGGDDIVVLYHYTNATVFENLAAEVSAAARLELLVDPHSDRGPGVLASQHEPS
ncbi:kidins220, partial [Symbiodinium pilosum]